ncbi:MAG TPA: hypothetical protein VLJ42_06825 [Solirubrobacteraceae bacterium]|nr:hypothetical protein [Solirubrobacteraceae bacterium]
MSVPALERLELLLREQGGLMASVVDNAPEGGVSGGSALKKDGAARARTREGARARSTYENGTTTPARLAAGGPRTVAHREEYELLLEAIYEGYLLHYATPRVVRCADPDLALLAGDRLYALGLARLAALGDVHAVAELADVIALSALAHGAQQPKLAELVWVAGARAIGWGASAAHADAKALAYAGAPAAIDAMRTSAEV